MIKNVLCFIALISLLGCVKSINRTDLFISTQNVVKTSTHQRIKGTKIFAVIPDNYKHNKNSSRISVSGKQNLTFVKLPNISWSDVKDNYGKNVPQGYWKKIKLHGHDGVYTESTDSKNNIIDISVHFGGEDFVYMITGRASAEIPGSKEQTIEIIKSIYYDDTFELDELELAEFTFDRNIFNYHLLIGGNGNYMYGPDKNKKPGLLQKNTIVFKSTYVNDLDINTYHDSILKRNEKPFESFHNKEITQKQIGIYDAKVMKADIQGDEINGILYHVLLSDNNNALAITGICYDKIESFVDKFERTVESIRFKEVMEE